jgi:hypothetical protein
LQILDTNERYALDNELNEQEHAHGLLSKLNTPIKQSTEIAELQKIGMKFDCDDSAYEFYKEYAHQIGFSARKQFVKQSNLGIVQRRTFCCSKEGKRVVDKQKEQVSFHHLISRVGCLA